MGQWYQRKADMEKKCKDLQQSFQEENNRLKEIIKKENEERQRDMKDVEAYVKNENAQRIRKLHQYLTQSNLRKKKDWLRQKQWRINLHVKNESLRSTSKKMHWNTN